MYAYTIDQERKRAAVETRLHTRYPGVELDVYNLPGLLRIVAHFGTVQLVADHDLKYNVFALVKMFAEDVERAALAADVIRQKGGHL